MGSAQGQQGVSAAPSDCSLNTVLEMNFRKHSTWVPGQGMGVSEDEQVKDRAGEGKLRLVGGEKQDSNLLS